jgi:hypothetical protein
VRNTNELRPCDVDLYCDRGRRQGSDDERERQNLHHGLHDGDSNDLRNGHYFRLRVGTCYRSRVSPAATVGVNVTLLLASVPKRTTGQLPGKLAANKSTKFDAPETEAAFSNCVDVDIPGNRSSAYQFAGGLPGFVQLRTPPASM